MIFEQGSICLGRKTYGSPINLGTLRKIHPFLVTLLLLLEYNNEENRPRTEKAGMTQFLKFEPCQKNLYIHRGGRSVCALMVVYLLSFTEI